MAKAASREKEEAVTVERTTGSVYHSLGYNNADEMERKAMMMSTINDTVKERRLTQVQAAQLMGIDQPTLSKLVRGRFRSISLEKLASMLNALGRDVTIVVGAMPESDGTRGRTLVAVT